MWYNDLLIKDHCMDIKELFYLSTIKDDNTIIEPSIEKDNLYNFNNISIYGNFSENKAYFLGDIYSKDISKNVIHGRSEYTLGLGINKIMGLKQMLETVPENFELCFRTMDDTMYYTWNNPMSRKPGINYTIKPVGFFSKKYNSVPTYCSIKEIAGYKFIVKDRLIDFHGVMNINLEMI